MHILCVQDCSQHILDKVLQYVIELCMCLLYIPIIIRFTGLYTPKKFDHKITIIIKRNLLLENVNVKQRRHSREVRTIPNQQVLVIYYRVADYQHLVM